MNRLLPVAFLLAASVSLAAEPGAGHPPGIPWGDIVKQLVNFAILVAVLVYFLRKPLSTYLKERSEMMRKSIEDASRAREEAAAKLSVIETRMSGLSGEIAEMNRRMSAEAEVEALRIRETAQAEIERVRIQAHFAADQEVKKAKEELRKEAAALATGAAEEIVRKALTPEDQERLVKENIEKIREAMK